MIQPASPPSTFNPRREGVVLFSIYGKRPNRLMHFTPFPAQICAAVLSAHDRLTVALSWLPAVKTFPCLCYRSTDQFHFLSLRLALIMYVLPSRVSLDLSPPARRHSTYPEVRADLPCPPGTPPFPSAVRSHASHRPVFGFPRFPVLTPCVSSHLALGNAGESLHRRRQGSQRSPGGGR